MARTQKHHCVLVQNIRKQIDLFASLIGVINFDLLVGALSVMFFLCSLNIFPF